MKWVTLFWIFVVLNIGDFISTKMNVDITGPHVELNPLVYWIIITVGIYAIIPLKALVCWIMWKWKHKVSEKTVLALNLLFAYVVSSNFYTYFMTI